jgi:hypothetical protein
VLGDRYMYLLEIKHLIIWVRGKIGHPQYLDDEYQNRPSLGLEVDPFPFNNLDPQK